MNTNDNILHKQTSRKLTPTPKLNRYDANTKPLHYRIWELLSVVMSEPIIKNKEGISCAIKNIHLISEHN